MNNFKHKLLRLDSLVNGTVELKKKKNTKQNNKKAINIKEKQIFALKLLI